MTHTLPHGTDNSGVPGNIFLGTLISICWLYTSPALGALSIEHSSWPIVQHGACLLNEGMKNTSQVWESRERETWMLILTLVLIVLRHQLAKKHVRWYFLYIGSHLVEKYTAVLSKCEHKIGPTPRSNTIYLKARLEPRTCAAQRDLRI